MLCSGTGIALQFVYLASALAVRYGCNSCAVQIPGFLTEQEKSVSKHTMVLYLNTLLVLGINSCKKMTNVSREGVPNGGVAVERHGFSSC